MERDKIEHQPEAHRFVVKLPEGEARLEYSLQSRWVNITHTWVPSELRGRGVADSLMQACQQWCLQEGFQLVATCSYAVRWLERKAK
jgi:Predicted acetyltransferase